MLMGWTQFAKALQPATQPRGTDCARKTRPIFVHFRQTCSVGRVAKVAALRLNAFESPEGRPGSPAAG
jgi:hypothetical protein